MKTVEVLNTVWSLDFIRDTLNVINEGSREGRHVECGNSILSLRLARVMQELVEVYGKPEAVRLYGGPEMTSLPLWTRPGIRVSG